MILNNCVINIIDLFTAESVHWMLAQMLGNTGHLVEIAFSM